MLVGVAETHRAAGVFGATKTVARLRSVGLQSVRSVVPRLCHNHLWCPTRALPAHVDPRLPSNAVTVLFCGLRSHQSAPLPRGKSQRTVTSESRESEARRVEQGKGQEVVVRYQLS